MTLVVVVVATTAAAWWRNSRDGVMAVSVALVFVVAVGVWVACGHGRFLVLA
jgi:hypothetical protein